jgi:hypothetical protein
MREVIGLAMFIAHLQAHLTNTTIAVIVNNSIAHQVKDVQANAPTITQLCLEAHILTPRVHQAVHVMAAILVEDLTIFLEALLGVMLVLHLDQHKLVQNHVLAGTLHTVVDTA